MGLDNRIGPKFLPGIGFGGSLPKDVTALEQLAGNSATTSSC